MTKILDFDSALQHIGEFGRHQKKIYLLVNLICIPFSATMLIIVFVGAVPEWKCPSPTGPLSHCNSSHPGCCDKHGSLCPGAEYTSKFTSIATEWNLVCDSRYKTELTQSIFVAGHMFGGFIFGILSDKYGRRRPWLFVYFAGAILALMSSVVSYYEEFLVLRFAMGLLNGGGGLTTYVISTESIGPAYRATAGTWQHAFYNIGYVILALEAYLIRDWRTLTVISVLPYFILILFVNKIPESPRWLASQGRTREAETIMRKIEAENGYHNSDKIILKTETKRGVESSQYGTMDLFTHKSVFIITIIMMITWCMNSMVYYGLVLNVKNLEGSLYVNFALGSLIDLPSCAATQFLLSWLGRRQSLICLFIVGSMFCFLCMVFQSQGGQNVAAISTAAFGGRFCLSASFAVLYVYASELFPTVARSAGMGISSLSARIGGIIAPFIVLLGDHHIFLPMFVFACAALFAGVVGLRLHETKGKPLPETFEDLQ